MQSLQWLPYSSTFMLLMVAPGQREHQQSFVTYYRELATKLSNTGGSGAALIANTIMVSI